MEKHIGRTDQQLAERLQHEPHVPTASTFPDRATAESAISKVLDDNHSIIKDFLEGTEHQLVINQRTPDPIGTSWVRGAETTTSGTQIRLIIRRDQEMPNGYRIHTGFPNP